jgi:hypothetical protein
MRYSTDDLRAAVTAGVLPEQPSGPKFDMVHLLWYAGAVVVIGAMGLFLTLVSSHIGGGALTITALVYAGLFTAAGHYLWTVKQLRTPGGLLIAIAVAMTPLAVFGVQDASGAWTNFGKPAAMRDFYTWVKGSNVFMELATIAAASVALRFYRFPFIVWIIAVALWLLSMDVVPWVAGPAHRGWALGRQISIWFGLGIIAAAIATNLRQRNGDFAFWLYLLGVATFWGGITAAIDGNLEKALYCALNIGLLAVSVALSRRVFAVFGTIGIALYLMDLADSRFKNSLPFPFSLLLIGIGIIALGLYAHRHQRQIDAWVAARLPQALGRLRA